MTEQAVAGRIAFFQNQSNPELGEQQRALLGI